MLRRAHRRRRGRRARVATAEHHGRRGTAAVFNQTVGLQAGRSGGHTFESRVAGVLSLTPRSSGASVAIRFGSRVSIFLVCDCLHSTGAAREDDGVAAGRRSFAVPRSATSGVVQFHKRETMANKILIPTPLRPFTGKQDAVE